LNVVHLFNDYVLNNALIEKLQQGIFSRNVKMKVNLIGNILGRFVTKMIKENYRVMIR